MGNCCPVATIIAVRSATLGGVVVALVMERGHVRVAKKVCCWCSYSQCIPAVLSSVFSVCSEYVLSCTEDVPACGDTCDKVSFLHLISHYNSTIGACFAVACVWSSLLHSALSCWFLWPVFADVWESLSLWEKDQASSMLSGVSLWVSLQQPASVWKALLQEKGINWSDYLSTHSMGVFCVVLWWWVPSLWAALWKTSWM